MLQSRNSWYICNFCTFSPLEGSPEGFLSCFIYDRGLREGTYAACFWTWGNQGLPTRPWVHHKSFSKSNQSLNYFQLLLHSYVFFCQGFHWPSLIGLQIMQAMHFVHSPYYFKGKHSTPKQWIKLIKVIYTTSFCIWVKVLTNHNFF